MYCGVWSLWAAPRNLNTDPPAKYCLYVSNVCGDYILDTLNVFVVGQEGRKLRY